MSGIKSRVVLVVAWILAGAGPLFANEKGNLLDLRGSWGGNGSVSYPSGRVENLTCASHYTGEGANVSMALRCVSGPDSIHFRATLEVAGGRVAGTWEERTYNLEGQLTGTSGNGKATLRTPAEISES